MIIFTGMITEKYTCNYLCLVYIFFLKITETILRGFFFSYQTAVIALRVLRYAALLSVD